MNPYFQSYVMPDGSTRRPIVERVPECRPPGLRFNDVPATVNNGEFVHDDVEECCSVDGEDLGPGRVSEQIALALCRCACEDWIESQNMHPITSSGCTHNPESIAAVVVPENGQLVPLKNLTRRGKTKDDAIAALAHAVADAKGIAP